MMLWGTATLAADDVGATSAAPAEANVETFVSLRVNGPRGTILLQDEMPLPIERVIAAPDGKHSLGIYVARMDDGRAVVELVAGKEKDGKPVPKVQKSFELQPFQPELQDLQYKKSKWAVEGILGKAWDAPEIADVKSDTIRYVLAWDDAKLLKSAPALEEVVDPKAKKPKPKPADDVVVERELPARNDAATQASPMTVIEPHGTRFIKAQTVLEPSPTQHCAIGGPPPAPAEGEPVPTEYYVGLSDLVPRMTSREVVGKFSDGTGYRVAAGVPVTLEGAEGSELYRVQTGGLSFVVEANEEDLAFYYRPTTHFDPAPGRPMSMKPGTVGTTQVGEVSWTGDGALPIQGLRGVAAPIATLRVPCAEVRVRPDVAQFAE